MRLGRLLFVLSATSAAASACTALYSLEGFDQGSAGSSGAGGVDAGDIDAADEGDAADAPGDVAAEADAEMEAGPTGPCAGKPDGTPCPAKDTCHAPGKCAAGVCTAGPALADGTGFDPSAHTACCGGEKVSLTTNDNCNVCGLKCTDMLECKPQGTNPTIYQCTGCQTYGNSCWGPHCCVTTVTAEGVCAAADCVGNCPSPDDCPNGSTCVGSHPTDRNNYCTY
jgi:hypothetical protein